MINVLANIKGEDKIRYKLVFENSEKKQNESQTDKINIYNVKVNKILFRLIDSPGFIDTKGKEVLIDIGFSKKKLVLSIVLDCIFALGLLAMFMKDGIPYNIFNKYNIYAASYIITAGIFEMTFIYGFLRMSFEKAFGIIPAIILTSGFYSFHHAGFQPEFLHLFLVGLMYCSIFYITHNILIIFPLFWGIGALWDVIISSEAGEGIKNFESFIFAVIIWFLIVIWFIFRSIRRKKNAVQNIDSNNGNAD